MDHFNYQQDLLFAEEVPLSKIAEQYGTPSYVYSRATLERHAKAYTESFNSMDGLVCFSVKALSNVAILKVLKQCGCGFDIVSGGELHRALLAGADPQKIIFSGVGKSKAEMAAGIKSNILSFNVESESELMALEEVAKEMNEIAPVAIRFNPGVDAGGHEFTKTGRKSDKFGVSIDETIMLTAKCIKSKSLNIVGLTCHIGSQISELEKFSEAATQSLKLLLEVEKLGAELNFIDMGGGLGVTYVDEKTVQPYELIKCYEEIFRGRPERLIVEPGRSISANAGILLTKVEYKKNNFLITDAAMNDLLRPALYQAQHDVWQVNNKNDDVKNYNIVGPICETGDFLAKDKQLSADEGDFLALRSVGAYGFVMSSNYNSRMRSAEILVDKDEFHLIRRREELLDLTKLEEGLHDEI
ncbi:diaminopimelate decarboxylase [Gammaproteobacteria bacterium]|nr:diaminopimelate decarboxylase [Gammaproteobacteria bacterium]